MMAQPNNYQCDINMKSSENAKATYIWHAHTYTYACMHTSTEHTGSKLFNSVVKEDPIHKLI